ncbi:MAG: hypothetical protein LBM12_03335 [Candidatus Nomurabacteria bacterium]|jgi:hypothetical protein|nr:hypothetical protein [Candidatus Nomurabacteria bacterium]
MKKFLSSFFDISTSAFCKRHSRKFLQAVLRSTVICSAKDFFTLLAFYLLWFAEGVGRLCLPFVVLFSPVFICLVPFSELLLGLQIFTPAFLILVLIAALSLTIFNRSGNANLRKELRWHLKKELVIN